MSASSREIADLKSRVSNLENALQGMWVMLKDLQPPATQDSVQRLMRDHFYASKELGGFISPEFTRHPEQT